MRKRCSYCGGSGKQMGKGMLLENCKQCVKGWIDDEPKSQMPINKQKLDKRSKMYKEAIANIKNSRDGMTNEEAEKLFEEALEKV